MEERIIECVHIRKMMFVFNGDRPITNLSDDDDDGVMRALSDVSSE